MACPSCDHTMQNIGIVNPEVQTPLYWCPRCGTLKSNGSGEGNYTPKLVQRVRDMSHRIESAPNQDINKACWKAGIWESVFIRPELSRDKGQPGGG